MSKITIIGTAVSYCDGCPDKHGPVNVIQGLGNFCSDCTQDLQEEYDEKPGVQEQ